jgi:hypothetical protein
MLPIHGRSGDLSALTRNGATVSYATETIKGVEYAILPDASGDYVATYPAPSAPHPAPPSGPGGGGAGGGGAGGSTTGTTGATTGSNGNPVGAATTAKTKTKAPAFVTASASKFRPGAKRTFVITVHLTHDARIVVKIRDAAGKVVKTIRVAKRQAGSTVRIRWNGKDSRGRYVAAKSYRYSVTATDKHYLKTATGKVAVLRAR